MINIFNVLRPEYLNSLFLINKTTFLLLVISLIPLISIAQTEADTLNKPAVKQEHTATKPVSPVSLPGMTGPLTINPEPLSIKSKLLHTVYVSGVVSGLGQFQNHVFPGDRSRQSDLGNGQIFIQKNEGFFQFFLQFGAYSIPDIGLPFIRSTQASASLYGTFPQGFLKLAPTKDLSFIIGILPTLLGAEYTFSFENMNIQRGLLWNQENAVNRGAQINYKAGPLLIAASYNDGLYSNTYNWLSGSVTYTINSKNSLAAVASGSTSRNSISTTATPLFLNNQQLYDLIYTYTSDNWTIQPYLQYTYVPASAIINIRHNASTLGSAILINYSLSKNGLSLPLRLEYITSTGNSLNGAPSLLYGAGSGAWSATMTPTYQYNRYFARAELSYVHATHIIRGQAFGNSGNDASQSRAVLEIGILF